MSTGKPPIVLVHGIMSYKSGEIDIQKLAPYFAGHEVIYLRYGFRGPVWAALKNSKQAERLAEIAPPGSWIVAHSNGGSITQMASLLPTAQFKRALLISPAMDNKAKFGGCLEKIIILYSKTDIAIQIAQYIPWHPWGAAGATGHKGNDPRVTSINKGDLFDRGSFEQNSWGHLDIFASKESLDFFGPLCVKLLSDA